MIHVQRTSSIWTSQRNIQNKEISLYFFCFVVHSMENVCDFLQLSFKNCKSSMIFIRFHPVSLFTTHCLSLCTKMTDLTRRNAVVNCLYTKLKHVIFFIYWPVFLLLWLKLLLLLNKYFPNLFYVISTIEFVTNSLFIKMNTVSTNPTVKIKK